MSFFRSLVTSGGTTTPVSDSSKQILEEVKKNLIRNANERIKLNIDLEKENYIRDFPNYKTDPSFAKKTDKHFDNKFEDAKFEKTKSYASVANLIDREYLPALKEILSGVFNTPELQESYQLKTNAIQRSAFRSAISDELTENYILATSMSITKELDDSFKQKVKNFSEQHLMIDIPNRSYGQK